MKYMRELVKLTSLLYLCSWIVHVQSHHIMLVGNSSLSLIPFSFPHTLSLLSVSPWKLDGLPCPSLQQGGWSLCKPGDFFCLSLLLHADSTTSVPIATILFLLEVRNEHMVCTLQVSEQVFVDGCPSDSCYLWCAAVRKLNLISLAETFLVLNSNWGNYFILAFPSLPVPTIWYTWCVI